MRTLHVLIVDDHPVYRSGLRALLAAEPDVTVVGEASDGREAVERATELQPDVVVMDLQMPGGSGIDAIRHLVAAEPDLGVLVITMFDDDHSVFAAMRAGARGYVLKDSDEDEVLGAIRAIAKGEAIFSAAVARRVLAFFAGFTPSAETRAPERTFPELTQREREVLDLIAHGLSNTQIAGHLVLSPKTVRNHISSIFAKLQVADRAQAIVRARRAGLG
jgi:DNA-binding NarL/FixJ family response regulator